MRGLSITMPLKERVLPLLHTRDTAVEQMGACNTLLRRMDGSLAGFNTDVDGILDPLARQTNLGGKRVLVLESRERVGGACTAHVQPRETLAQARFDILINSTPYGMRGKTIDPPIEAREMNCDLFFDLVYNPVETPLVRLARQRHIAVLPGVAMFVAQGVRQFALWTEKAAPEGEMLREVMDPLGG